MTTTTCCGRTPRGITIGLSDSALSFLYCAHCETKQWFRDGQPTTLTGVKAVATQEWSRKRGAA